MHRAKMIHEGGGLEVLVGIHAFTGSGFWHLGGTRRLKMGQWAIGRLGHSTRLIQKIPHILKCTGSSGVTENFISS